MPRSPKFSLTVSVPSPIRAVRVLTISQPWSYPPNSISRSVPHFPVTSVPGSQATYLNVKYQVIAGDDFSYFPQSLQGVAPILQFVQSPRPILRCINHSSNQSADTRASVCWPRTQASQAPAIVPSGHSWTVTLHSATLQLVTDLNNI